MSQSRQHTPSSPTPSKSSLRRTSGTQNPSQRSLIPSPSPHFEDQPAVPVRYSPRSPPNQTLEYESDEDDEPLIYPEVPAASGENSYFPDAEPERPFQPFFTLIEDGLTSEHHHPSVHYIFADDDAEIITEAALRSLEQDDLGASSTTGDETAGQGSPSTAPQHEGRLPYPRNGVREHYLIFDVQPIPTILAQQQAAALAQHQRQQQTQSQSQNASEFLPSYAITSFTSLSPDWQISSASITSAPTMSDTPGTGEDEGLMLRIEGQGLSPPDDLDTTTTERAGKSGPSHDKDTPRSSARDSLEDMIDRFQSRLGEIKKLIEIDAGAGNIYRGVGIHGPVGGDGGPDTAFAGHDRENFGFGLEEQD